MAAERHSLAPSRMPIATLMLVRTPPAGRASGTAAANARHGELHGEVGWSEGDVVDVVDAKVSTGAIWRIEYEEVWVAP